MLAEKYVVDTIVARQRKVGRTYLEAVTPLDELTIRPGALCGVDLAMIRNRTLVLVGALDATTPPPLAEAMAARIPGSRFKTIPGCGHCPMLETPAELVALIEAFLAND